MKNIYYDLIEKYSELDDCGLSADGKILAGTEDSSFYCAVSRDRINVLEGIPFSKEMKALQLGADYGVFAPLAERIGRLDIADPADEKRELVKVRFPKLIEGGKLCLIREAKESDYDLVILDLAGKDDLTAFGKEKEELVERACSYLKEGGSLLLLADNSEALRFIAGDQQDADTLYVDREYAESIAEKYPFAEVKRFYPLPNASFAKNVYSGNYLPEAGSFKDITDYVFEERTAVINEAKLYGKLCQSGVFEQYAPSFVYLYTGFQKKSAAFSGPFPDYVRINQSRKQEYALKTEIFFTDAKQKKGMVRKTALSAAANAHIESFSRKYELLLSEISEEAAVLKPVLGEDSAGRSYADFEYLCGEELGEKLAALIEDGKAPIEELKKALKLITGDGERACHNLDALLENVLVTAEGKPCFIDYEWVLEEAQDPKFIKFRILYYWFAAYKSELSAYPNLEQFLDEFGITAKEIEAFEETESRFQESVSGGENAVSAAFKAAEVSPVVFKEQGQRIRDLTDWNLRLQDEIEEHKTVISKEREVERLSQNHIRNIEKINEAQKQELEILRAQNAYLAAHQSIPSRVKRKLIGKLDAWAPAESRKRKLIHYTKNTLKHPAKQCRLYFTAEGRKYIRGDFTIGGEFAEGGLLTLPKTETPLVSIVIPAYNQVAYTYACIRSIIEHTDAEETPYEVILADDVSTDSTKEIGSYIANLIISRNSSNMGFLKNCNQAAAKARGEFVFFLNNDTKVHPNWLSSLVRLMRRDASIGMVGSKLVYPDGRLQEAGGIIWSDASGWNYGRLDDPEKPEYNYVKDVDYISGAAIMIRTELWKEIGGFDEYFAPAYCEDSDLAFEVRRHGKRVVYQPQSVVTHFEGISNGTDVQGSGLKRYQLVNQEKFKEKWKEELKKQSVNTGNPDPFSARDRSQGRPCVVVIDHYVPTWDKDAGSKTTYQYLKMFLKKGFNVKFVGDNFLHEEPYSSELQQLGIEILYGVEYRDNIYEYFRKNTGNIDFCYLNRPHIAVKYVDFLKKNTDIKCIFYGHDLHYLRIFREYELTGEIRKKRESDYWRSLEFSVMEQSDMVYYPSQVEIDAIHKYRPEIPAKAITAYVWDDFSEKCSKEDEFAAKEGLLFVGGFKHPPNADAVKWFAANIWPKIREAIPGIHFYVAGSGADEDIKSLQDSENGLEILGFVSDERLNELYETTRLTVVPLRYGAGVKGKVVEAIYNSSVVVTTSVGAEGIPNAETVMSVVDDDPDALFENADSVAADFAKAVIRLYQDTEKCAKMSTDCGAYIREHYSIDAAWAVVADDFEK